MSSPCSFRITAAAVSRGASARAMTLAVVRIDREAKQVEVHDLRRDRTYEESYDKLVLCTGE